MISKELLKAQVTYRLARRNLIQTPRPLTLTYSVTSACQSLCKSCNIGLVYQKNPKEMLKGDMTIDEVEKIFKSIGHVYFFNISGGEPFLRTDIVKIAELACKHLTPKVIHTPTNALMPSVIERKTREILDMMRQNGYEDVIFTIKPSYDGIGKQHDHIRGVQGNYEKLMDTLHRLIELRKEYKNLHVGLGTVISKMNMKEVDKIII